MCLKLVRKAKRAGSEAPRLAPVSTILRAIHKVEQEKY